MMGLADDERLYMQHWLRCNMTGHPFGDSVQSLIDRTFRRGLVSWSDCDCKATTPCPEHAGMAHGRPQLTPLGSLVLWAETCGRTQQEPS